MKKTLTLITLLGAWGAAVPANAFRTQLGDGDYLAHMVINFSNGAIYEFDVQFSDLAWTGRDLMNYVEAESTLVSHQNAFDFGDGPVFFLDGLEFDGNSNIGFGGGDNWWRYWIRDGETGAWESPVFGFSDRTLSDGSWDGWVYGSANPPTLIPEPGTVFLFGLGIVVLATVRRGSVS